MAKEKLPEINIQRELDYLANAEPSIVTIPYTNKKVKIGWLENGCIRKISSLLLNRETDDSVLCKAAALMVLGDYWRIRLLYAIKWRWYYYVKHYKDYQMLAIIEEGKKKVQQIAYLLAMGYLNGLSDTVKAMTKEDNPSHPEP